MVYTFLKKSNNAKSSLNGAINSSATSLIVVNAGKFPNSGSFLCTIWDKIAYPDPSDDINMEIVKVTSVSGNVFTIVRGQESTTAVAHSSSNAIELLITKGVLDEYETQINIALESAGIMKIWGGMIATVPSGYLFCNGAEVSRTTFANLFAAIGTVWGIGDGATTFNLPDSRNRQVMGACIDDITCVPVSTVLGTNEQCGGSQVHGHHISSLNDSHSHSYSGYGCTDTGYACISGSDSGTTDVACESLSIGTDIFDYNHDGATSCAVISICPNGHTHGFSGLTVSDSGHAHTFSFSGYTDNTSGFITGDTDQTTNVDPFFAAPFIIKT